MKCLLVLCLFLLVVIFKTNAQNGIRADQAADSIGKIVQVTAHVINVHKTPHSRSVSLDLSDWRSKQVLLTLIIYQTNYRESNTKWLQKLNGEIITFQGKVFLYKGRPTIREKFDREKIGIVTILPEY